MGRYSGKKCRLISMFTMTTTFFLVELIVGYITNSMALIADSFHMLSDVLALIIAFLSIKMSPKKWSKNTFGWARAEVLGALVNSVFLLALCFSIFVEALKRLYVVEELHNPQLIFAVGVIGLIVNIIGLGLFHEHGHGHSHGGHGHSHGSYNSKHSSINTFVATDDNENDERFHPLPPIITVVSGSNGEPGVRVRNDSSQMNMRGVFLHILSDALGSVIVIISALIVWLTNWQYSAYIDPALSLCLVLLITASTWPLLKDSAMILLQTVPTHIQVDGILKQLRKIDGVLAVHEFHIWQLAGERIIASAHIRCRNLRDYMEIAEKIKKMFHEEGIHSTTIQPEFVEVEQEESISGSIHSAEDCILDCPPTGDKGGCAANTCCGIKQKQNQNSKLAERKSSPFSFVTIVDETASKTRKVFRRLLPVSALKKGKQMDCMPTFEFLRHNPLTISIETAVCTHNDHKDRQSTLFIPGPSLSKAGNYDIVEVDLAPKLRKTMSSSEEFFRYHDYNFGFSNYHQNLPIIGRSQVKNATSEVHCGLSLATLEFESNCSIKILKSIIDLVSSHEFWVYCSDNMIKNVNLKDMKMLSHDEFLVYYGANLYVALDRLSIFDYWINPIWLLRFLRDRVFNRLVSESDSATIFESICSEINCEPKQIINVLDSLMKLEHLFANQRFKRSSPMITLFEMNRYMKGRDRLCGLEYKKLNLTEFKIDYWDYFINSAMRAYKPDSRYIPFASPNSQSNYMEKLEIINDVSERKHSTKTSLVSNNFDDVTGRKIVRCEVTDFYLSCLMKTPKFMMLTQLAPFTYFDLSTNHNSTVGNDEEADRIPLHDEKSPSALDKNETITDISRKRFPSILFFNDSVIRKKSPHDYRSIR